jgi:acyl carrier protein
MAYYQGAANPKEGSELAIDRNTVLDIIAEEALVERARLTPEATLDSLGIASLDIISIVFALEERFGLTLEQADFEGVQSLGQFVDLILDRAAIAQL